MPPLLVVLVGLRLLGGVTREREEDVVERRPAQPDVVDLDPLLAEPAHDVDELRRAAVRSDRQPAGVPVDRAGSVRSEQRRRSLERLALVHDDLDPLAADLRLQLVRRSRAR